MKPVVVIVGISLLLLIVGVCCTPSQNDSDSDSDLTLVAPSKGLDKPLNTGRIGYKYEDKMCVAVKDAPNEHANPPIYDSLMDCYRHHTPLDPLGFKWLDDKCKAVAVEPNHIDVFLTEKECVENHKLGPNGKHHLKPYGQYGYKYEGKMCVGVHAAPNEHANPPIYSSLLDCYRHHTPLDPLGFKWVDGKCEAVADEPNHIDVFLTEKECVDNHKLGPHGKDNHPYGPNGKHHEHPYGPNSKHHEHPYGPGGKHHEHPYGPNGKHHEHPYGPNSKHHEHPYGPNGKHHEHPYGPNGKHHEHPYGPGGMEDGYKLVNDGKEEECVKVNKPIDNVSVFTKDVCEYKLENGYGPHGKGFNPDGPHGKGYRPDLKPHPGHDECTCEKNQYIMINSN